MNKLNGNVGDAIYSVDTDGNEIEVVSFPKPEPKKKNKKITQKAA